MSFSNNITNKKTDDWVASNYVKHASFVPKLGNVILDMLDPQPIEHILDFGCGDGVLSKVLAARAKSVIGIDASEDMIASAQKQEGKPDNIEYFTVDGYALDTWFDQTQTAQFDAVFSSAVLHWLSQDPIKAITNIHHVLRKDGRFVAEFGGFMNIGEIHTGLIYALNKRGYNGKECSPWFFPSSQYYSQLLTENGFKVLQAELVPRMTELNTDIAGWIEMFGFEFLKPLKTDQERQEVMQEVQEHLRPAYQREDGKWVVMYNRLRIIAIKE